MNSVIARLLRHLTDKLQPQAKGAAILANATRQRTPKDVDATKDVSSTNTKECSLRQTVNVPQQAVRFDYY